MYSTLQKNKIHYLRIICRRELPSINILYMPPHIGGKILCLHQYIKHINCPYYYMTIAKKLKLIKNLII